MPAKLKLEEVKVLLNNLYPEQLFIQDDYKDTRSKIKAIDPIYGEQFPTVHNLMSKHRKHPLNRTASLLPLHEVKKQIFKVHKDNVVIDENTYVNKTIKCRFIDKDFGEFFMSPQHVCHGSGHKERGKLNQIKLQLLPIKEVVCRLKEIHGDTVIIDESTYSGMYKKAKFIHKIYGEQFAIPHNVLKGSSHPQGQHKKSIESSIKKYGTKSPMQNIDVFRKASKNRNKKIILKHQKTNDDIVCTSSYEYTVANYLNEHKIDYDQQIKIQLTDDMVYYIDLYLKKENKYIEIKGIFQSKKNELKQNMFNKHNKNSELWKIKDIVSLVGKKYYWIYKDYINKQKEINLKDYNEKTC